MSTRETIAHSESQFLAFVPQGARSRPAYARILASSSLFKLAYLCSDLFAVTLAHGLAVRIVGRFLHVPLNALHSFANYRFYILFFAVVLYLFEGYKSPELRRPEQELEKSCKAMAVTFLGIILFNLAVLRSEASSRYLLFSWFVLACFLLVALRFTLRAICEKLWRAGLCRRRALVFCSEAGLSKYQQLLSIQRHYAYDFVRHNHDSAGREIFTASMHACREHVSLRDVERCLASTGAQLLIIAQGDIADGETCLKELVRKCKQLRVDVELYSEALGTANLNYEHDEFSGCFRFYATPEWSVAIQRVVKRGLDLGIGLVGSAVTLLLIPVIFVLINLEDRGPLFYRSAYLGQDGSTRYYLKFRTMHVDADERLQRDAALRSRFQEKQ